MSTQKPEISILVPIYNVEKYLDESLASLQAQSFSDIEIICINDGSTDSSKSIIERYLADDARFKLIDKTNSGYGDSMNKGLQAAQGTYLAIVESDDFIVPDTLATLHGLAEKSQAQVVKANFYRYWSVPSPKKKIWKIVDKSIAERLIDPHEETQVFFMPPSLWSALYRRDFLEENGIRFLPTPGASFQDTSFAFKVWAHATRVVCTPAAYLHYRQDNEASSVNSAAKAFCIVDEFDEMERWLLQHPDQQSLLSPVFAKLRYASYLWNYERLAEELQLDFLEKMSADIKRDQAQGFDASALLKPWQFMDYQTIARDPQLYQKQRAAAGGTKSSQAKLKHYYKLGGASLVSKIVRDRFTSSENTI